MTGQTAPGGDFPASWPNFGAEALAVAGSRHLAERRFFLGILLLNDPPDRTSAKRARMTAPSIACRGFGQPALLLSLAAAAVAPRPLTSQRRFQRRERKWVIIRGDVNHGPTGQLAELWRLRPSPGRSIGRPLRCGVFHIGEDDDCFFLTLFILDGRTIK